MSTSDELRDMGLEELASSLSIDPVEISYDEYIEPVLRWASVSSAEVACGLDVDKVSSHGVRISGLFGGEKKGVERAVGLVIEEYEDMGAEVSMRLYGLDEKYKYTVVKADMSLRDVGVFTLFYRGYIDPFRCIPIRVLLPTSSVDKLKEFLSHLGSVVKGDDKKKIDILVNRLGKKSIPVMNEQRRAHILRGDHYYVLYRSKRTFSACFLDGGSAVNAVPDSSVGYIAISKSDKCAEVKAYYYTGVLNYLAYRAAAERRGGFVRDQYDRPLIAIMDSGLSFRRALCNPDVFADFKRAADLSRELSRRLMDLSDPLVKQCYSKSRWAGRRGVQRNILECLKDRSEEFKEIINILDKHVTKEALEKALSLVSEKEPAEPEEEE